MDVASGLVSDLMKFSMTDSCKATEKHMVHPIVSIAEENLPVPIIIDNPKDLSNTKEPYSKKRGEPCGQEVTSQELPVFVNNPVQSPVSSEEVSSEHLPIFLDNSVQPTISSEEASSEYLPVFLNNFGRSAVPSNEKMSSSDIPICLKR